MGDWKKPQVPAEMLFSVVKISLKNTGNRKIEVTVNLKMKFKKYIYFQEIFEPINHSTNFYRFDCHVTFKIITPQSDLQ